MCVTDDITINVGTYQLNMAYPYIGWLYFSMYLLFADFVFHLLLLISSFVGIALPENEPLYKVNVGLTADVVDFS